MASMARVYSFVRKVSLVSALSFASGCAALPPPAQEPVVELGPTLDSPYVLRVCLKQPGVSLKQRFWANHASGTLIQDDWELGLLQRNGQSLFYFDPDADPQSVRMLPIPYNKLECPVPTPSVLSSTGSAARAKPTAQAEQKPAAQTTTATTATTATTTRVDELPPCTSTPEPGQTRARSTSTYTCRRTRTLQAPSQPAPAIKPGQESRTLARVGPVPTPAPTPAPPALVDWNVAAPNLPGVDAQRAMECLGSLCHARHPNFAKKPGKPANGALSTSGGGGGAKPSKGTPSTRKPPSGPKPAATPTQPETGVKPKTNEAPTASTRNTTPGGTGTSTTPRVPSKTLRKQWETETKRAWPKDPKTGRNQDVAHKKALADGGSNKPDNIEPMPHSEHTRQHREAGDFKRWGARGGAKK